MHPDKLGRAPNAQRGSRHVADHEGKRAPGCAPRPRDDDRCRRPVCRACRDIGPPIREPALTDEYFITADGTRLPYQMWRPTADPDAVILALHGFNDYSNAFARPAAWWAERGVLTYAYDQRGFGATGGAADLARNDGAHSRSPHRRQPHRAPPPRASSHHPRDQHGRGGRYGGRNSGDLEGSHESAAAGACTACSRGAGGARARRR